MSSFRSVRSVSRDVMASGGEAGGGLADGAPDAGGGVHNAVRVIPEMVSKSKMVLKCDF